MDFRTDKLLHGGDYNPEQWLKRPDILAKDIDIVRGVRMQCGKPWNFFLVHTGTGRRSI